MYMYVFNRNYMYMVNNFQVLGIFYSCCTRMYMYKNYTNFLVVACTQILLVFWVTMSMSHTGHRVTFYVLIFFHR